MTDLQGALVEAQEALSEGYAVPQRLHNSVEEAIGVPSSALRTGSRLPHPHSILHS